MNTITLRFLIVFTFSLISVSSQGQGSRASLVLKLDNETAAPSVFNKGVFHEYDGQLYYLNHLTRDIKVFDLASGEVAKTIDLHHQGPNSVGPSPYTFLVASKDSLFLYSDFNGGKVSLVDGSGRLMASYDLLDGKGEILSEADVVEGNSAFALNDSHLFTARFMYDYSMLELSSPIVSIDLVTQKKSRISKPLMYPHRALYKVPKYRKFLSPSIAKNTSILVLSYPLDHWLYFTDDGFQTFKKVKIQSEFMSEFTVLGKDIGGMEGDEYQSQAKDASSLSGRYFNLLYSEEQGVYYRLLRLPFDKEELSNYRQGLIKKMKPQEYAVMTLSRDLNVINEVKYSEKDYHFERGAFADNRGLWVLKNSSDNEDEMIFELIK